MRGALKIRYVADLDEVLLPFWVRRVRHVALADDLQVAAGNRAERLVRSIDSDLRACGCILGAVFCMAGMACLPLIMPRLAERTGWGWTQLGAVAFLGLIGTALIGKILGIAAAEVRLRLNIRRLQRLVANYSHDQHGVSSNSER